MHRNYEEGGVWRGDEDRNIGIFTLSVGNR